MRKVEYVSPTSLNAFYEDRTEFYLQRLADNRPPKFAQTQPMAVGSAFDAYIKSYIADALGIKEERFEFERIFEAQVEAQNRDWARTAGADCFKQYKELGALADLMHELKVARHVPRMEFETRGHVNGVPLLGKPDLYFVVDNGEPVILDFKVNGYCSKSATSPRKGYIMSRGTWGRGNGLPHPDAHVIRSGVPYNASHRMEEIDTLWATQLLIYAWTLGEDIETPAILGIEQLCFKDGKMRVASHRSKVGVGFARDTAARIGRMWQILESGHIFDDMPRAESDERCKMLDLYHAGVQDDLFRRLTRDS